MITAEELEKIEQEADEHYAKLFAPHEIPFTKMADGSYIGISVGRVPWFFKKCPRCWHYHGVLENYGDLCDRCTHVYLAMDARGDKFQTDTVCTPEYISEMKASWFANRKRWCKRPETDTCNNVNCCRKDIYIAYTGQQSTT